MQTISYPSNQTTRHSSAARSRLLCDDEATDDLEGMDGGPHTPRASPKHRRLASEGPLDSFLSETETVTSHSSFDSDDAAGDVDEVSSLASGTSLDGPIAEEYDEGDLRALNSLVNRLHAAQLARLRRERREDGSDLTPRRSLSFGDRAGYGGGWDRDDDLPSELPDRPPQFTELAAETRRSLSYAAVEGYPGPCLEVVPTEDVPSALPRLQQSWSEERSEWRRRRAELLDRRSRSTAPGAGGVGGLTSALRTRSSPAAGRSYRYGKPPTIPHASLPNPMVTRSSKRIHRRHARYALTAGMMLGIRESICGSLEVEVEAEMSARDGPRHLGESELLEQCEQVSRYKFPPNQFYLGSNTSRPLPHKYKFKVYSPLIFARIRSLFGVDRQEFLHSICGKFNFYEFASNARSGQVSICFPLACLTSSHEFWQLMRLLYAVLLLLPRRTVHDKDPNSHRVEVPPGDTPPLLPTPDQTSVHDPHPFLRDVPRRDAQLLGSRRREPAPQPPTLHHYEERLPH